MNQQIAPLLPMGQSDLDKFEQQVDKLGEDYEVPVIVYPEMDDDVALFGDLYHMNLDRNYRVLDRLGRDLDRLLSTSDSSRCGTRPATPDLAVQP